MAFWDKNSKGKNDAPNKKEEERRKEDIKRRLRLLQIEVDIMKRQYNNE